MIGRWEAFHKQLDAPSLDASIKLAHSDPGPVGMLGRLLFHTFAAHWPFEH